MAPLFVSWDCTVGEMRGHGGFPRRQCLIAAIQAQAEGKAHRATDVAAGHRVMSQGIGAVAMVVMPVHIVEQTPHLCAQGSIDDDTRVASSTAMGFGLLEPEADAATMDRILPPRRLREETGAVRWVGTVEDSAGDLGQTLSGQDDQPRQIVPARPPLTPVLKQVAEDCGVVGHHRRRCNDRPFHAPPPRPGPYLQLGPSIAWGPWHGKSPHPR